MRESRNDRLLDDLWRALGVRDDGGDRLQDLLQQLQTTQAKLDALSTAVKVLQDRPVR